LSSLVEAAAEPTICPGKSRGAQSLAAGFVSPSTSFFHGRSYFVSRYFGTDFLLQPTGIGTLEISAKIAEQPEIAEFMARCARLRADLFLDIGANIGLYTCILLTNGSVPRAILFEPDRTNRIHLRANLMINGLLDLAEIHKVAVGDLPGRSRLVPGRIDGGFSRIIDQGGNDAGYNVDVVTIDDVLALSGQNLAIKIDVEHYECNVLAGMARTLRSNRCLVQIETFETRERVIAMMADAGYDMVADYLPNFVFENRA
jgi:FkbM family methyltransferase